MILQEYSNLNLKNLSRTSRVWPLRKCGQALDIFVDATGTLRCYTISHNDHPSWALSLMGLFPLPKAPLRGIGDSKGQGGRCDARKIRKTLFQTTSKKLLVGAGE